MIKILVADDSAFMRKLLTDFFARQKDFQAVGAAKDGQEAVNLVKKLRPDVVTMDVNMHYCDW